MLVVTLPYRRTIMRAPKNQWRNCAVWMKSILVSLTVLVGLPVAVVAKCSGDFACSYNHFCYKPSGICIQCLDCSLYNRGNSESQSCHRSPEDCGACMKGFKEEYLAQQVKREACVLGDVIPTTTTTTTTTTKTFQMNTMSPKMPATSASEFPKELVTATAAVSVACVVVFSVIGLYVFKLGRIKVNTSQAVSQDEESSRHCRPSTSAPLLSDQVGNLNGDISTTLREQPPPYDEIDPGEVVTVSEERVVILHVPEQKPKEVSLNAIPWRDMVHYSSSSSESIEGDDHSEPSDVLYQDEETNPSTWEPGPDHRPRHLQLADSVSLEVDDPEEDTTHSSPSDNTEHAQTQSQASSSSGPVAAGTTGESSVAGASSTGTRNNLEHPFRHLGREDNLEQPARKRLRQEDTLSLDDATQVSASPLQSHGSYSSLDQDLTVISRFPPATSNPNIRHH